jgi:hypothetical protein
LTSGTREDQSWARSVFKASSAPGSLFDTDRVTDETTMLATLTPSMLASNLSWRRVRVLTETVSGLKSSGFRLDFADFEVVVSVEVSTLLDSLVLLGASMGLDASEAVESLGLGALVLLLMVGFMPVLGPVKSSINPT